MLWFGYQNFETIARQNRAFRASLTGLRRTTGTETSLVCPEFVIDKRRGLSYSTNT